MSEIYCLDCNSIFNSKFKHKCPQNLDDADYDSYLDETKDFAETPEANESSTRDEVLYLNSDLLSRAIRLSIFLVGEETGSFYLEDAIASSDAAPNVVKGDENIFDMAPSYSLDSCHKNIFNPSDGITVHSLDTPLEICQYNYFWADDERNIGSNEKRIASLSMPEAAPVAMPASKNTRPLGNGKAKLFVCDVCCKAFSRKDHFQKHYRTHKDDKPYICDECGERFHQRPTLQSHIRIHTNEKPYVCDECGYRFRQISHLQTHIRIHTGEKPYVCDACGKRFRQHSHLKSHVRIHTGEKPYVCNVCSKRFARVDYLQGHIRTHTRQ